MNFIIIALLISTLSWSQENCPVPDLVSIVPFAEELNAKAALEEDLITVEEIDYPRSEKATYCTRPVEMVDTLVIHHSETPSTTTALDINTYHLNRGTAADPWYMMAYGFVINSPYAGNKNPEPKVSSGRPIDIVSASQGSNVFIPMDATQVELWDKQEVKCGNETLGFKYDPKLVKEVVVGGKKERRIKANVTTLGIVVNGNYAPYVKPTRNNVGNINGYPRNSPRYPTPDTQLMIAKLACQLQRKYPRLTKISWHSAYNATSCPGTLKSYIGNIKALAKGFQCEFQ